MTINELLEHGIILQGIGRVSRIGDPDDDNPYGTEQALLEAGESLLDLHGPVDRAWADREIRYMYPLPWRPGPYPMICIEVG
ncbi:hypothetical protein EII22_08895 [Coriobacteriales bacterium OH1046]|nr:hypothetical protein EII22_08895 [Coriobacteriales bacterium OH1046]